MPSKRKSSSAGTKAKKSKKEVEELKFDPLLEEVSAAAKKDRKTKKLAKAKAKAKGKAKHSSSSSSDSSSSDSSSDSSDSSSSSSSSSDEEEVETTTKKGSSSSSSGSQGMEAASAAAAASSAAEVPRRMRTRSMELREKAAEDDEADAKLPKEARLSSYRISADTAKRLKSNGIVSLFPIQVRTFDPVYDRRDVIGRARTGCGKTLAFSLPIGERLLKQGLDHTRGRPPKVLIMTPTRELASQIEKEFRLACPYLSYITIYGGASYQPQENALWRGVDVVIGTPGRIIDHIERKNLVLTHLDCFVLDEADRMLDMGFQDEMDKVFDAMRQDDNNGSSAASQESRPPPQILLFSATLAPWVQTVSKRRMKDALLVDLVKGEDSQASINVKHFILKCPWQIRPNVIADLLPIYGGAKARTIIFVQTKRDANELVLNDAIKEDCGALHGDIPQKQRETALNAFKKGSFTVLVATDVASRGLHINNVDLVINYEPPSTRSGRADVDTYIHRSGRTGRAGQTGTCITLYTVKQERIISQIEREIGNNMTRISAPQPMDLVVATAKRAMDQMMQVDDQVLDAFRPVVREALEKAQAKADEEGTGGSTADAAEALLCRALAEIAGVRNMTYRSMLSSSEGFKTYMFKSPELLRSPSLVFAAIRRHFPPAVADGVRGLTFAKDQRRAVFDVPVALIKQVDAIVAKNKNDDAFPFKVVKQLPELAAPRGGRGGGRGGGGRGGGRGGRGGRGGFSGRGRGRGGGRGRGSPRSFRRW